MSSRRIIGLCALLIGLNMPVSAESVQGLVLDRTTSLKGKEFFEKFYMSWIDIPQSNNVNITVAESFSAKSGSAVSLYVEESLVYQVALTPRKDVEEYKVEAARKAALNASRYPASLVIY